MKTIVFTGGGTAGHIIPNISIISYLQGYDIHYIGSYGLEKDILSKYPHIHYYDISSSKLRRSLSLKNLTLPYKVIKGIIEARHLLKRIKPDVIFSKGGYVSLPVVLAGKSLGIPIITHESDISLGLANKIIAKFCTYVLCSFRDTVKGDKYIYTGPPLRPTLLYGDRKKVPNIKSLDKNKKTILVLGGSLGAKAINELIYSNIDTMCSKYNIIHITGNNKSDNSISHPHYISTEYTHSIEDYFDACDYIISRAGSNAIFEILALGKKAILIPLSSSSRGEQIKNAEYFYNKNLVDMVLEKDLNIDILLEKLSTLDKLKTSSINIDKINKKIVRYIAKVL